MSRWPEKLRTARFCLLLLFFNSFVARLPSHAVRDFLYRRLMRLNIGPGSSIHMGLRLYARGRIAIGAHTVVDRDCVLDGRGSIEIGDNVNLAPEVMILTASHDPDAGESFAAYERPVRIGNYVWVATRALILPGVTLGERCIVAAGAVVTRDVAPGTIVGGNPARPIRQRRGEQTYRLDYRRPFH